MASLASSALTDVEATTDKLNDCSLEEPQKAAAATATTTNATNGGAGSTEGGGDDAEETVAEGAFCLMIALDKKLVPMQKAMQRFVDILYPCYDNQCK